MGGGEDGRPVTAGGPHGRAFAILDEPRAADGKATFDSIQGGPERVGTDLRACQESWIPRKRCSSSFILKGMFPGFLFIIKYYII